jgi:hypothetical protein
MGKITPDDYAAYREAHGRAGSYDQVAAWCAAQDKMILETQIPEPKKVWVRRAGFVRFDHQPNYRQGD